MISSNIPSAVAQELAPLFSDIAAVIQQPPLQVQMAVNLRARIQPYFKFLILVEIILPDILHLEVHCDLLSKLGEAF